jgi:hypothetical protein
VPSKLTSTNGSGSARAQLRADAEAAAEIIFRSVVPLAVPDRTAEYPESAGSAVLLEHVGKRFLVTAAHNLDFNPDCTFYIGTPSEWLELPFGFIATHKKQAGGRKNRFDYAVLEIEAPFAERLGELHFLSASQIARGLPEDLGEAPCVFAGYPDAGLVALPEYRTSSEKLIFRGSIASRSRHVEAKLKPYEHVAVNHSFRRVVGQKGLRKPPRLEGTSGGGIFLLRPPRQGNALSTTQLIAITSDRDPPRGLVYGARIDVILRSIELKFVQVASGT